jgi:hypothetical protein
METVLLFQKSPVQIETDYEFTGRQHQIARIVARSGGGLRVREGKRKRMPTNVLLDAESNFGFRLGSDTGYLSEG